TKASNVQISVRKSSHTVRSATAVFVCVCAAAGLGQLANTVVALGYSPHCQRLTLRKIQNRSNSRLCHYPDALLWASGTVKGRSVLYFSKSAAGHAAEKEETQHANCPRDPLRGHPLTASIGTCRLSFASRATSPCSSAGP